MVNFSVGWVNNGELPKMTIFQRTHARNTVDEQLVNKTVYFYLHSLLFSGRAHWLCSQKGLMGWFRQTWTRDQWRQEWWRKASQSLMGVDWDEAIDYDLSILTSSLASWNLSSLWGLSTPGSFSRSLNWVIDLLGPPISVLGTFLLALLLGRHLCCLTPSARLLNKGSSIGPPECPA